MEEKVRNGDWSLGGEYVVVDKQSVAAKEVVLFIEARIRDEWMMNPEVKVSVPKVGYSTFRFLPCTVYADH